MKLKVLFIAFLCLLAASMICNLAMTASDMLSIPSTVSYEPTGGSHLTLGGGGVEPDGDDRPGGGWP